MPIKVNYELNPAYEIITLLYHGYDMDRYRRTAMEEMNQIGYVSEEAYQKHFAIQEKYFNVFIKNRITSERDSFYFKDTSQDYFLSFITIFLIDESFIHNIHQMNNEQVFQILLKYSGEILEQDMTEYQGLSHEEFIKSEILTTFINKFDITANEKWKLLLIFQNPQDYYSYFADLVIKNTGAYEKAVKAMKAVYDKYIEQYKLSYSSQEKVIEFLNKYNMTNCGITKVYPTMASAAGLIVLPDSCYIGLLMEKTMTDIGFIKDGNDYLLSCLKALSDPSKMNIMTSLKVSPKYATELASQLGLTSATISHHMNALLAIQLVYIKKENGRYYYHINKDTVTEVLEQLSKLLL